MSLAVKDRDKFLVHLVVHVFCCILVELQRLGVFAYTSPQTVFVPSQLKLGLEIW